MKIKSNKLKAFSSWFLLGALFISSILFGILTSSKPSSSTNTRAAAPSSSGGTITVSGAGAAAIQKAFDSAKDGDTVVIPPGTYSDNTAVPFGAGDAIFVSADRGGAETCFVRIEKKNITIKGTGAILFGEGHDSKAGVAPFARRGGLCILNSTVTIDGLKIKEFQKRCLVGLNSNIIYKNGTVEGCDEGGISLLGDSSGLFVNNYFFTVNFGGVMLWQNSQAKIVNNTFYGASIMFFYHPKTDDKAFAEITNNIVPLINQVDWWTSEDLKLKTNKLSHNIIWKEGRECGAHEYCDAFPGKIDADPLFTAPVFDPRGMAAWSDMSLKEGSPAIGSGDPSIPGPKNIGITGGPCVDPNSSICTGFIAQNTPKPFTPPAPTEPPTPPTDIPIEVTPETPPEEISSPPIQSSSISSRTPIDFSLEKQASLFIIENMGFGTITINGLRLKDKYIPLNKNLDTGQAVEYPLKYICNTDTNGIDGNVLYTDEKGKLSFTTLKMYCNKTNVFDIQ